MTKAKKEIVYWVSVFLYGVILFGALLYLRFPEDSFRIYCQRVVEKILPGISCTIEEVQYDFPFELKLIGLRVTKNSDNGQLLFEDPLFSIQPVWSNLTGAAVISSQAFGGSSKAYAVRDKKNKLFQLRELNVESVALQQIPGLQQKLGRKISGSLAVSGNYTLSMGNLKIQAAEGVVRVSDGSMELKKPILELSVMDLTESSITFSIQNNIADLKEGTMKSAKLTSSFQGKITLTEPVSAGEITIQGNLVPQAPLYQGKEQLKTIVARMQKRYKSTSLPYKISGTVERPTFVFNK